MNLRCFPNQVIVERIQRSRRYLPIVSRREPPCAEGRIVAIGLEKRKDGSLLPPPIFKGAWVTFRPFAGKDFEFEGRKLKLLKHEELETVFTG